MADDPVQVADVLVQRVQQQPALPMTAQEEMRVFSTELNTRAVRKFRRRTFKSYYINDVWSADLMDVSSMEADNHHTKFLLVVVDIYSRYAWCLPIISKSPVHVKEAFQEINALPEMLNCDQVST